MKAKLLSFPFHLFFRIGTFQCVMADSNKKIAFVSSSRRRLCSAPSSPCLKLPSFRLANAHAIARFMVFDNKISVFLRSRIAAKALEQGWHEGHSADMGSTAMNQRVVPAKVGLEKGEIDGRQ